MKVAFFITVFTLIFNYSSFAQPEISKDNSITQQSFQEHTPLAHHKTALEVLKASKDWIDAFNAGNSQQCADGYSTDAVMHALPFGKKKGRQEILGFWKPFIESGASDLVYTNLSIEVANETTAFLSANWRMNVGRGIIFQEKWEKINSKWVLIYDNFEVLEQYETLQKNTLPVITSHQIMEDVIKASIAWTDGFNTQNSTICGNGYAKNASLNAVPFASLHDKKAIHDFWKKLMADGARNLTYHNPIFKVLTAESVQLSSAWSMNIGEGKIYQEKWIKENDNWVLGYDEFRVLKQY